MLLAAVAISTGARAMEPRFEPVGEPGAVRDNVVSALTLDARGLLWAGSAEGLLRFDGYAFRRYPLCAPDGRLLASAGWDNRAVVWAVGSHDHDAGADADATGDTL